MSIKTLLVAVGLLACAWTGAAGAGALDQIRGKGEIRIAVYNNFPPYSNQGKGIDVDIAHALAEKLGVKVDVAWYEADENMDDDLRNIVWKGHYLNGRTADVMMHVPVDKVLQDHNDKVKIFAPYQKEQIGIARNVTRVPNMTGPAGLEAFTREKIGVETETISDTFLMGAFNGRLRENVVHFKSAILAMKALKEGEVAAVMAPLSELEAGLGGERPQNIALSQFSMRGLSVSSWNLGVAVKAESGDLAEAVGRAMDQLRSDGTLARIFQKYGVTYVPPGT